MKPLLVEMSADGGNAWQPAPFSSPGPGTTISALTASADGFTVAGQFGAEGGDPNAAVWTSADGTSWARTPVIGLTGGGSHAINALARSGSAVNGIDSVQTQAKQKFVTVPLSAR